MLKALNYVVISGGTTATGIYGSNNTAFSVQGSTDQSGANAAAIVNTSGVALFSEPAATTGIGSYPIGGSGATLNPGYAGYQITYDGTFTILPRPLIITALPQGSILGTTPVLDTSAYTETGLVPANGDVLSGVTLSTTASRTSPPGDYPITVSNAQGVGLANYAIRYIDGVYAISGPTGTESTDGYIARWAAEPEHEAAGSAMHVVVCFSGSDAACVGLTILGGGVNLSGLGPLGDLVLPPWISSGLTASHEATDPRHQG